jgi:hypothetical protein
MCASERVREIERKKLSKRKNNTKSKEIKRHKLIRKKLLLTINSGTVEDRRRRAKAFKRGNYA